MTNKVKKPVAPVDSELTPEEKKVQAEQAARSYADRRVKMATLMINRKVQDTLDRLRRMLTEAEQMGGVRDDNPVAQLHYIEHAIMWGIANMGLDDVGRLSADYSQAQAIRKLVDAGIVDLERLFDVLEQ